MENEWEESIPEYGTQSLDVMIKIDKVLRITKPFFRQIILEVNKNISQGHGLFHVKEVNVNVAFSQGKYQRDY